MNSEGLQAAVVVLAIGYVLFLVANFLAITVQAIIRRLTKRKRSEPRSSDPVLLRVHLPTRWTDEERIQVASVLLGHIQLDIPAERYSEPGRPNVDTVLAVLLQPARTINQDRDALVKMLNSRRSCRRDSKDYAP